MMMPDNVVSISTSIDSKLFKYWVEFFRPFHHLTDGEMNVLAALLKKRYELSKVITDQKLLDEFLFSEKTRKEIRESCGITLQHFQVILGKLKKAKVLSGTTINPKMIPHIKEDADTFNLLISFNLK